MKVVAVERTTLSVPDLANLAKDGPVILTHQGKPLAAVKSVAGSDWESVSLANNPKFLAIIEASRAGYRENGGISLDELRRELGLKPAPRRRSGKKPKRSK